MRLKLEELQRVVKKSVKEERTYSQLREELYRVLGPSILGSDSFTRIAELANERLDYLEATGNPVRRERFKISTLIEAANSSSPHARKLAARLLPEKMSASLLGDKSSIVRCAAARRAPSELIKESIRRYPDDDQLRSIERMKRLEEAGIPDPKIEDEPFDVYGEEPLGDAVKTKSPLKEPPDSWYTRTAHKLCSEYGTNLEGQWEEILATRIAASHYATSGVKIDREKLLKAIYDCIEEREDAVIGEGSLKTISRRLMESSHMDDAVMPVVSEEVDPVDALVESNVSSAKYIELAEKFFSVKKSSVPAGIKKYTIGEGRTSETLVPMKAVLPDGRITPRVEEALDRYVSSWNKVQESMGEPYRLTWYPHPSSIYSVGFNLELK